MVDLTKEQKDFLIKHNVDFNLVFDARGLKREVYKSKMKLLNKKIAITDSPCGKGWHVMRNSSWHCLQCNPQSLTFSKNYNANDYVYVAISHQTDLFKVGSAKDIKKEN